MNSNKRNIEEQVYCLLLKAYYQQALMQAKYYCSRMDLAEDIVQDVFTRLWERRENLPDVRNWKSYLFILVRNHSFNYLLRERRSLFQQYTQEGLVELPWLRYEEKNYQLLLHQAIRQLPRQQQLALRLYCEYCYPVRETAACMGVAPSSVKSHLKLARRRLYQKLRCSSVA